MFYISQYVKSRDTSTKGGEAHSSRYPIPALPCPTIQFIPLQRRKMYFCSSITKSSQIYLAN